MGSSWTKITVKVKTENLNSASDIISMLDSGLMIEDFSDFSLNGMYGELVDESILNADTTHGKISLFVPEEKLPEEYTAYISTHLSDAKIEFEMELECTAEDDWADSWKSYFKPMRLGKITIVPSWEEYSAKDGETIVKIDPGMAFGTGTHETTRLVMKIMQDIDYTGAEVLDIGCGSGILSICASKLGAKRVNAYDIDPVAVKVAKENIASDNINNITVGISDLLSGVEHRPHGYDVCVANIVADIILRMLPDIGGYLKPSSPIILSGIVASRKAEIISTAAALGYRCVREECENDWVALMIQKI